MPAGPAPGRGCSSIEPVPLRWAALDFFWDEEMELRFSRVEHGERFYPICECLGREELNALPCFLVDDGGLGLAYHIPRLRECIVLCERTTRGISASEDFTTECFAACIDPRQTSIYSITSEPESGETVATEVFLRIVSDWVEFLEHCMRGSYSGVVVHRYGA